VIPYQIVSLPTISTNQNHWSLLPKVAVSGASSASHGCAPTANDPRYMRAVRLGTRRGPRSTRHCTTPDIIRRGVRIGTAHKHQHRLEMRCGRTCREAAVAVNLAPVDGVGVRGADRPTRLLTTAVMQLKRWQQTTRSATCSSGCSHRRPRRQPRSKTYAITAHGSRAHLGASRSRAEQVAAAVVEAGLGADAAAGLDRTQDGVLS
jgi:hypothetical protein